MQEKINYYFLNLLFIYILINDKFLYFFNNGFFGYVKNGRICSGIK